MIARTVRARAGFSEIEITPPLGLPTLLAGPAARVRWPLFGRIALFDDGDRRAAVVALDLLAMESETVEGLRAALADPGGLDAGDILINCTHTHSGPYLRPRDETNPDYLTFVTAQLVRAMAAAASSLEPATIRFGLIRTEGVTFNRRYLYADGRVVMRGPRSTPEYIGPEGPADGELQLLLALRSDESIVGGLIGFSCHPDTMVFEPVWSADYPGALTEKLSQRHGGTYLFLQGALANLQAGCWLEWAGDYRTTEPGWNGPAYANQLAESLHVASDTARTTTVLIEPDEVGVGSRLLELERRQPTAAQAELAEWVLRQDPDSVDGHELRRRVDAFNRSVTDHGFTFDQMGGTQPVDFASIRDFIQQWGVGPNKGAHEPAEVQVIAIGDLAIVGCPREIFTEFGIRTKAESPFPATIVCGLANGSVGYVPTADAFEHGGYETWPGVNRLTSNAGETITNTALALLNELYLP